MGKYTDKLGVYDTDTRFHKLSLQLFGEPSEYSLNDFRGPVVDFSQNLNRKSAANLSVAQPTQSKLPCEQRCFVCYSVTANLESKKRWNELNEFLRILQEPVGSLNENRLTLSLSIKQLTKKSSWCLCDNCNAACDKLVEVHRQMKILEQKVKVFQAKFLNVIKLSKAIAEKAEKCKISANSSNGPIDRLRTSLIGGTEKWEAVRDKWMGYVNFEQEMLGNDSKPSQEISPEENTTVKIEFNCGGDNDNQFVDDDNTSNLSTTSNLNNDDDNHNGIANKESIEEQVDNLEKNVKETGKYIVKPYKKRDPKPGRVYVMTPKAIRYRALRAKYSHLSDKEMRAHLKTLPKIERKGIPKPKLAIEELSKTCPSHIKWRKTFGKTMSLSAYREMRRKELMEVQKVKDGQIAGVPSRSNIGVAGFRIKWEEKREGRMTYNGVEVRKNEDGTLSCVLCENNGMTEKPFNTKQNLSVHIKKRHIASTNGHACDKCDAKFYYHFQLVKHIEGKHVGFQCEICGVSFPYESSLFWHKRVKHQGIKPHVCEHCGKGFATRKDMTIHVRRHTGERPFVCHVCAQTFIEKQSMKKHIKKLHPGEPFDEPVKQNTKILV